ncbi:MAG TPA: FAD-binding oxidoreductase [Acidimicrobiales bacterium]|nr:FAD-binding oxidoreductase [Acidimicrobiales bacterium]
MSTTPLSPIERRVGALDDAIDGVIPLQIASPTSTRELERTFQEATQDRIHMVLIGNRTKIEWGQAPTAFELGIHTGKLPKILQHEASDLVVRVSTNVTLGELQTELNRKKQRLAVDSMIYGTTVGGMIATGLSGPLRYGFGSVRDLIIGATVVRSDGVRATAGGRVVKNVAGYDLAKLYTGSYGTLGAITEAFFRLHSLPDTRRYLLVEIGIRELNEVSQNIIHSQMAPSAFEIYDTCDGQSLTIGILIEGTEESVFERSLALTGSIGKEPQVLDDAPPWWGQLPGPTTFKVTTEIASAPSLLEHLHEIGKASGEVLLATGSLGSGVLFVGAPTLERAREAEIEALTLQIRAAATLAGGSCIVLRAPAKVRNCVDVWGPVPAIGVMRSIKSQFDPFNLLAPGRFVGGI